MQVHLEQILGKLDKKRLSMYQRNGRYRVTFIGYDKNLLQGFGRRMAMMAE